MFGHNIFNGIPRSFKSQYRCYSVSMLPGVERKELENGDKIVMPPSALDLLTRLKIVYPMLFKLTDMATTRTTHCGVLEFTADEGKIYIPYWMMQNLILEEGGFVTVESISLPVATFAKFQPHSCDFLDLTNQKAVLESRLRHFACLSKGDVIAISYNHKTYEFSVLETKPADAVTVIECDLNVDFEPPVGYKEPSKQNESQEGKEGHGKSEEDEANAMDISQLMPNSFQPFSGKGLRLDGKEITTNPESEAPKQTVEYVRGIPDYDFKMETLTFIRKSPKKVAKEDSNSPDGFKPFQGKGNSLSSKVKK